VRPVKVDGAHACLHFGQERTCDGIHLIWIHGLALYAYTSDGLTGEVHECTDGAAESALSILRAAMC
jgi:hypothetical protein